MLTPDMMDELEQALGGVVSDLESSRNKNNQNKDDRKAILEAVGKDLGKVFEPYLNRLEEHSRISGQELARIIQESIKIDAPAVDTEAINTAIVKAFRGIKFPVPQVTVPPVSVPPITVPKTMVKMPDFMKVLLSQVDRKHPVPVELVDIEGNPYYPNSGGGGAFPRVISLNSTDSYFDQANNAMRVDIISGSVSLSGNDTNQGPSGANTLRVVIATDSENSTNLNQLNGNTIAAGIGEANNNTLRVAFATDAVASIAFVGNLAEDHNIGPSGANTLRVTIATDSVESVNIQQIAGVTPALGSGEQNSNTLRVSQATDAVSSVNLINQAQGSGEANANSLRTIQATDAIASSNIVADYHDTNIGPSGANTLRTTIATDAVESVNIQQIAGVTPALGSGEANANTLRVIAATDAVESVFITGSTNTQMVVGNIQELTADNEEAPIKIGGVARTTNPSKATDGQRRGMMVDAVGRGLSRPVQVRELVATAYATLNSNNETSLIAGVASTFLDLIYAVFANASSAAVSVDLRQGTGGAVIGTVNIPANATQGFSLSVPTPMTELAQAWTVKFNSDTGTDLSNTKVYVTGLFSKEV